MKAAYSGSTDYHNNTKFYPIATAEKMIVDLTAQDSEGWTYRTCTRNSAELAKGNCIIEIIDEDGIKVCNYSF